MGVWRKWLRPSRLVSVGGFLLAGTVAAQHYPAVRASLEQVNAAQAKVSLARIQYLPQLSGVYAVSRATQNQVDGIWLPTPITRKAGVSGVPISGS